MIRHITLLAVVLAGCSADPASMSDNAAASTAPAPSAAPEAAVEKVPATPSAHPCTVQDGKPVRAEAMRAIGTEPFWGAKTQGRCVTYSTPEDPAGTRVWTRFTDSADGRVWTGALRGKPFRLAIRAMADCSDGMSDDRFPFEARLLVDGEERRGCAEGAPTGR